MAYNVVMNIHIKLRHIGIALLIGSALIYRKREKIRDSYKTYRSFAGDLWFDHGFGNVGKIYHEAYEEGTSDGYEEGYCDGYDDGVQGSDHRFRMDLDERFPDDAEIHVIRSSHEED